MYEQTKAEREELKALGRKNAREFWKIVQKKLAERDAQGFGNQVRNFMKQTLPPGPGHVGIERALPPERGEEE